MADFVFNQRLNEFLAQACALIKYHGDEPVAAALVNSRPVLQEAISYDGFDRGRTGHLLTLYIPFDLFLQLESRRRDAENLIKTHINDAARGAVLDEGLDAVVLSLDTQSTGDWRAASGLLKSGSVVPVPETAQSRIWRQGCPLRVLISHTDEDKKIAAGLSNLLYQFGISGFVAHRDIVNSTIWPTELSNALNSMDACVALLTKNFHASSWTDQEIGWAFGRGVKVIPLNMGESSYGFMGTIQANPIGIRDAATLVFDSLNGNHRWVDAFINAVARCPNFDVANTILWPRIKHLVPLSQQQVESLVGAANMNSQIRFSTAFANNGTDGRPLLEFIKQHSDLNYEFVDHKWKLAVGNRDNGIPF